MAKEGVLPGVLDMFGPGGNVQLDALPSGPSATRRAWLDSAPARATPASPAARSTPPPHQQGAEGAVQVPTDPSDCAVHRATD
jgi:hypothetical protein